MYEGAYTGQKIFGKGTGWTRQCRGSAVTQNRKKMEKCFRYWLALVVALAVSGSSILLMFTDFELKAQEKGAMPQMQPIVEVPEPETVSACDAVRVSGGDLYLDTETEPGPPCIAIDPGHGGEDEGCSREGVPEKEINLKLAGLLENRLEEMGYEVILTRDGDSSISLEERVAAAENAGADIYISIHQNACEESKEAQGIETWYCGGEYSEDRSSEGSSIEDSGSEGSSVEDRSSEGSSVKDRSSEGSSVEDRSSEGSSVKDRSSEGRSVEDRSSEGSSIEDSGSQESSIEDSGSVERDRRGSDSRRLARLVHQQVVEETGAQDRELWETDELYVLRETSIPACLIETGFLSNKKERELLTTLEYQEKIAEGIAQGIEWYFHPKIMYLTFDDGPSEENTGAVLDILKEHDVKATFFVVGENVRKHPEVARRIVEEGHTIGIHCNNHEYKEIYADVDSYVADFEAAYQAVYEVTGVEPKLFRFPGGSINAYNKEVYEDIIAEMTERGFIYFDWNASLEDAVKKAAPEQLLINARESTLGRRRVVMLAHDIVYETTLCLEELLDMFPEYEMKPLTEDVAPIQF